MTDHTRSRAAIVALGAALGLLLLAASPASAQPSYSTADQARLASYTLTADHLARTGQAQTEMRKILAADPSLVPAMAPVAGENLDQQFKRLRAIPAMVEAIHKAGLTAQDYGFTSACAIGTYMYGGFAAHKSPPGAAEAWAHKTLGWQPSAGQLAFAAAHDAEMHAFLKTVGMER